MIIFWQHFFIVIVEASSSPCSPSSPHVSLFSTLFVRAHVCEKLLWCPYCTLCPCPTVHNFVFCIRERLQFQRDRSTIAPFTALKSRVVIALAAHTCSLFGSSIPCFMQVHYRLLITNQSHPNRQQNTIVMFDKNYLFLNQNFHEVYKWTALPPFPWKT